MNGSTFDVAVNAIIKGLQFNDAVLNVVKDLTLGTDTQGLTGLVNTDTTVGGDLVLRGQNIQLTGKVADNHAKITAKNVKADVPSGRVKLRHWRDFVHNFMNGITLLFIGCLNYQMISH